MQVTGEIQSPALPDYPTLRIEPDRGWASLQLRELWAYRELLFFLVWRDVKVRYKQTVIGIGWAFIQPFLTMVVFSIIFGQLANLPSDGIPYPIFSFAALVPWGFFARGLSGASNSMLGNAGMIKKVYFPRLILPIADVASGIGDFLVSFLTLLGMMVYFGIAPTVNVIWLPALLLLSFVTALGVDLWLSALNVQFRDVRYVVPFLMQFWMYATPVAYSSSLIPEEWKLLYSVNPMVGVIEGFRWALLGTDSAPGPMIIVSSAMAVILLISGALFFRRMEKTFADVA